MNLRDTIHPCAPCHSLSQSPSQTLGLAFKAPP